MFDLVHFASRVATFLFDFHFLFLFFVGLQTMAVDHRVDPLRQVTLMLSSGLLFPRAIPRTVRTDLACLETIFTDEN